MKFLLILGVVLIHCNIVHAYPDELYDHDVWIRICDFISSQVCRVCVPCFFIISGFLFFNGVTRFDNKCYLGKLRSRIKTLLIPYLIWCTICAGLLYIKVTIFHMPGLGIFLDNGNVDWMNLIKGYWSVDGADGAPLAFAFWFIRNLIVFVVISPVAWFIARNAIATSFFLVFCFVINDEIYGLEWFVIGSFLALHYNHIPTIRYNRQSIIITTVIFCLGLYLHWLSLVPEQLEDVYLFTQTLIAMYLVYAVALKLHNLAHYRFVRNMVASTFMIYATHQCICTIVRNFWTKIFQDTVPVDPIFAYVMSFLILVYIGHLAYLVMKRTCPQILTTITGGR